jgi:hypothetical protein
VPDSNFIFPNIKVRPNDKSQTARPRPLFSLSFSFLHRSGTPKRILLLYTIGAPTCFFRFRWPLTNIRFWTNIHKLMTGVARRHINLLFSVSFCIQFVRLYYPAVISTLKPINSRKSRVLQCLIFGNPSALPTSSNQDMCTASA